MSRKFKKWWDRRDHPKNKAHEGIFALVDHLKQDHDDLEDRYKRFFTHYSTRHVQALRPGQAVSPLRTLDFNESTLTLNIAQSCVDTLASKIATVRPRPQFLTDGGNWKLRRRAKSLEQFVESVFYQNNLYQDCAKRVFLDALIFGTGFLKVFPDGDRVKMERVFPGEIMIDEHSSLFERPRNMFQRKWVPAEVLKNVYAENDAKARRMIDEAVSQSDVYSFQGERLTSYDLVEVVEAWHLHAGKHSPGRHVVCVHGHTLMDEEYEETEFPFVEFRWLQLPAGFFGQGLVEQLEPITGEVNKLAQRIQSAMHVMGTSWVICEKGSINKAHLRNVAGTILEVERGQAPPTVVTPPSMNSDVFRHLDNLYQKAYQLSGVSQLSAAGHKPAGVESGVAMRTLLDVESERFAQVGRDWEQFFIGVAKKVVHCAKKLYEDQGTNYKVHWMAKDFIKTIEWKEVDLEEDSYVLKVYPTSMLPATPAGKLSTIQDLLRLGLMDEKQALALLDYPDLKSAQDLNVAALDDIDMVLDSILYDGKWMPPESYQDLEVGIKRATSKILRARIQGAPEDRLSMLQDWIEAAASLLEPPAPPALPGAPPPMAPGGDGLLPPELPGELPTDTPLAAVG